MDDNSIEMLKEKLNRIKDYLLWFWIVCFLIIAIGFLISIFRENFYLGFNLENLNNIGGFFNIVTSLTGVATVYLLTRAIVFQKEELEKVSASMDLQLSELKEHTRELNSQTFANKNAEIANRTINEILKWNKIRNETINEYYDYKKIEKMIHFFDWILLIKSNELSVRFDLNLIESTIFSDDVLIDYLHLLEEKFSDDIEKLMNQWIPTIEDYEKALADGSASRKDRPKGTNEYYYLKSINESLKKILDLFSEFTKRKKIHDLL